MSHSPLTPTVSPLSKSKYYNNQNLRNDDHKHKMEQINAQLQNQLDEALKELDKAHHNLQLQNQLKEQQEQHYLSVLKENEILKGDLQSKNFENEHNKIKLQQMNKLQTHNLENLKLQYEQMQQSILTKYQIDLNTKLDDQKLDFEKQLQFLQDKLTDVQLGYEQNQDYNQEFRLQNQNLNQLNLDLKGQLDELRIEFNQQQKELKSNQLENEHLKQQYLDTQLDLQRKQQENDHLINRCSKLERQFDQNIQDLLQSKDKNTEQELIKIMEQHQIILNNVQEQNNELWKQVQDFKQKYNNSQKETNRLSQLSIQLDQELQDKQQKLREQAQQIKEKSEQIHNFEQKNINMEQALQLYKSQLEDFKTTRIQFEERILGRNKNIMRQKEMEFENQQQNNEQRIKQLEIENEQLVSEQQNVQYKQIQQKLLIESQIKSYQVKLEAQEQLIEQLQKDLGELRQDQIQKQTLNEQLAATINKDKQHFQNNIRMQKNQIADQQTRINNYQIEIDRLSTDVRDRDETLEMQSNQFMSEKNELESTIRAICDKMSQYKNKINDLEQYCQQIENKLNNVSKEKEQIEMEYNKYKLKAENLKINQESQIQTLTLELEDYKRMQQQNEEEAIKNEQQINQQEQQIEELASQNQIQQRQLEELADEIDETKQEQIARLQEMEYQKKQLLQNTVALDIYEQVKKNEDNLKSTLILMETEIHQLQSDKLSQSKQIYNLNDELEYIKQQLQDQQSILITKKKESDTFSLELDSFKRENTRFTNLIRDLESKDQINTETIQKIRKDNQRLNDDLENKNRQIIQMEQQINKKNEEILFKNKENEDLRKKSMLFITDQNKIDTSPSQKSMRLSTTLQHRQQRLDSKKIGDPPQM